MIRYMPEGSYAANNENYEYIKDKKGLYAAMQNGVILQAPAILCDKEYNLHVSLGKMKGIIPKDEVQRLGVGEDLKDIAILTRVGKAVCFKVTGFGKVGGEEYAILSRRAAQEDCYQNYIRGLRSGDIIESKVTHLESFGAFVDIGCGITSLISIDRISVSRINHPRERLSVGQRIYTVVKGFDEAGRIYTSLKELLGTWEENADLFSEGQTVMGVIRSIKDYGVFVELTPNLAGLAEYRDDVYVGQSCAVYIKSINPSKMKIKLVIIDAEGVEYEKTPLEYFVDVGSVYHMDYWQYSPDASGKVIESVF